VELELDLEAKAKAKANSEAKAEAKAKAEPEANAKPKAANEAEFKNLSFALRAARCSELAANFCSELGARAPKVGCPSHAGASAGKLPRRSSSVPAEPSKCTKRAPETASLARWIRPQEEANKLVRRKTNMQNHHYSFSSNFCQFLCWPNRSQPPEKLPLADTQSLQLRTDHCVLCWPTKRKAQPETPKGAHCDTVSGLLLGAAEKQNECRMWGQFVACVKRVRGLHTGSELWCLAHAQRPCSMLLRAASPKGRPQQSHSAARPLVSDQVGLIAESASSTPVLSEARGEEFERAASKQRASPN